MDTRPDNYHASYMPGLRCEQTVTMQGYVKPQPLKKGEAVIVTDDFDKSYNATYQGKDGPNRSIISINDARTSVFNYKVRRA